MISILWPPLSSTFSSPLHLLLSPGPSTPKPGGQTGKGSSVERRWAPSVGYVMGAGEGEPTHVS